MRKFEQYQDMIARLFPELASNKTDKYGRNILSKVVTFQVTDACNLACTYCYQINKGERRMKFETAKKLIDMLLEGDPRLEDYVSIENSPALVIEFIGGEPFLNVELMEQICDYFYDRAIELMHPWATKFCISICSNGVLYRDPKVQHFLNKYRNNMSFSVTIDGNKELHDACRVFPDGRPSYDLAVDAAKDWISRGYYMGSKITIAPGNLKYLCDAIFHIQQDLDYHEINANVVYEEGWTVKHATEYYYQLKRLADHWVDNNLVDDYYLALFEENFFKPKKEDDIQNWCGGTGSMLSMDPDGRLFPCIRYMESSLGDDRPPLPIGHVDYGIAQQECDKQCIECLNAIDRRTQSTDECFYCPIADGCSWCFPAGTKISTLDGYKNIEDIKPRMKVLSSGLKEQEVESNMSRINKDNYIIQPVSGLSICSTDEHPFYIMRNPIDLDELYVDWIKAKEIDPDIDKLAILVQDLNVEELYKKTDEEYAMTYVLGMFVAKGYIRKTINPLCGNKIDIQYVIPACIDYNEDAKLSNILQYIPSLNYMIESIIEEDGKYHYANFVISMNDNIVADIANSCLIYELISTFTDNNKKVFPEVITNNFYLAGAFISGFFNDHKPTTWYQDFFNKNKDIGVKVYNIIHRLQKVRLCKKWDLFSAIEDNTTTNINLIEAFVINPIIDIEYDIRYPDIIWVPIKDIKHDDREIIVYNMSIKDSHQYIANDILVHNCSAYNYQVWGTADKRATYICVMHKARALANVYFWNRWYRKQDNPKRFVNYVPDKWALEIIPQEELDMLKELAKEDY